MKEKKKGNASVAYAEPIVACCTASGAAALALLRVSGHHAIQLVSQAAQLSQRQQLEDVASHQIRYGYVVDADGKHIDQVLFLVMHAPRTFTGEPVVEITCHNNPFIIDAIIARLCELGARHARPGEFTQRAVEQGKLDLLQAEALHDLIMAPSRALAQTSLAQLEGSLSHVMASVEAELISVAGLVEASFEFSEEEHIDLDFDAMVRQRLQEMINTIAHTLAGQSSVAQLREGIRIALVGCVNAGKSTLLNALLGRNRAIVSDQAGTTRDSIEASMSDGRYSWTFIDTAGLRETDDVIEQEGIVRTHEAAHGADIVMLVVDGSQHYDDVTWAHYTDMVEKYRDKLVVVRTKKELGSSNNTLEGVSTFVVSAQTGDGMAALKDALADRVAALYEAADTPFVLNRRHIVLLEQMHTKLTAIMARIATDMQYELLAAQLHDVLALVTELTGHNITEQIMDTVFSTFCIGK